MRNYILKLISMKLISILYLSAFHFTVNYIHYINIMDNNRDVYYSGIFNHTLK